MKFLSNIELDPVTTLPPAEDAPNTLVVHSGKLYWSDGTQWYDLTNGGGGGGSTRDEIELHYGYVYL